MTGYGENGTGEANDVLELEVYRSWEFNITAPLGSTSLPFALYGVPILALKFLNWYCNVKIIMLLSSYPSLWTS